MHPADTALSHVRRPSSSAAIGHAPKRRGFSLIEAAIVLGVVGLVIGGIWAAAATVNENMKVNATINAVYKIVDGTNNMYKNMPLPTSLVTITPTLIASGIIPADMIKDSSNGVGPWGGYIWADIRVAPMQLRVYLYRIPKSACVKILMQLAVRKSTGFAPYHFSSASMMDKNYNFEFIDPTIASTDNITSRCITSTDPNSYIRLDYTFPSRAP